VPDFFDTGTAELYHAPLMAASPKNETSGSTANGAVINSAEFAQKALAIHGIIAISQCSRLRDVLMSSEGVLDYRLIGGSDQDGRLRLQLYVHGGLQLSCQRCLEPFKFELNIASNFFIVPDESATPSSEAGADDGDYLVAETQMQVINLIEDEILLALPLAPKHEIERCGADSGLNELKSPNPFAVLQGLKTGKSQN
jgi:uncharacterized protein